MKLLRFSFHLNGFGVNTDSGNQNGDFTKLFYISYHKNFRNSLLSG